jgi:hypothetical protein
MVEKFEKKFLGTWWVKLTAEGLHIRYELDKLQQLFDCL